MQRTDIALGARFFLLLGPQRRLLWLPEVAIWAIFEFLGGLVIYNSYQCKVNYPLEIISFSLGIYNERFQRLGRSLVDYLAIKVVYISGSSGKI